MSSYGSPSESIVLDGDAMSRSVLFRRIDANHWRVELVSTQIEEYDNLVRNGSGGPFPGLGVNIWGRNAVTFGWRCRGWIADGLRLVVPPNTPVYGYGGHAGSSASSSSTSLGTGGGGVTAAPIISSAEFRKALAKLDRDLYRETLDELDDIISNEAVMGEDYDGDEGGSIHGDEGSDEDLDVDTVLVAICPDGQIKTLETRTDAHAYALCGVGLGGLDGY